MKFPRWFGPGAIAFLLVWLMLLGVGRSAFFRDPGTFWHTTTGELVLKDGFIRADPYTFTFGGQWWVPYQWLGEVGMALAHRVGGFDTQLLGAVTTDCRRVRVAHGSVTAHRVTPDSRVRHGRAWP